MKLDTDSAGNLVIAPSGQDSPIKDGIPQGIIIVLRSGELVEVFERAGKIIRQDVTVKAEFP